MPRTKGIPAYGPHKPIGQARVRIDGKDYYLGPHGSEEAGVDRSVLSRFVAGKRSITLETADRLAAVLRPRIVAGR
jgi:Helix-turn-helix